VIGRRFVPKGKLHGQWNLILRACMDCNSLKSDLEDDISAITLQPDVAGEFAHNDGVAKAEARRKARNAASRRTRKPVGESKEAFTLNAAMSEGVNFKFGFVSPSQADERRVFELARLQLSAFFYWLTFQTQESKGYSWAGQFMPVINVQWRDWGNPTLVAFADVVVEWEPRVLAVTADGFFKIAVRKHPAADCWSWALEWNRGMRVAGFFGDEDAAGIIASNFPVPKFHTVHESQDRFLRFRTEVPIDGMEDLLFFWDDDEQAESGGSRR
jgi:hypothetical protein